MSKQQAQRKFDIPLVSLGVLQSTPTGYNSQIKKVNDFIILVVICRIYSSIYTRGIIDEDRSWRTDAFWELSVMPDADIQYLEDLFVDLKEQQLAV
jgi:hypothetical protein